MTFSATATIQSIEKLNDKFFKVLLQDERRNHIIVNIPVEKEAELSLNAKISVWGNVSAFQYQSKWYNNLFVQTVVPEHKKYLLVQRIPAEEKAYKILEYGSDLFTREYIQEKYSGDKAQTGEGEQGQSLLDRLKELAAQPDGKQELLNMNLTTPEFVNLEYNHLQNAVSKRLVSLQDEKIQLADSTYFFIKKQAVGNLIVFQKIEGELAKVSDLAP